MGSKNESNSLASTSVWKPQSDQLQDLYNRGSEWTDANQGAITDAANSAANTSNQALEAAAPVWQKNLQGGNLAGVDIAGFLAKRMGDPNQVASTTIGQYGADNPTWQYKLGQNFSGGNSSLDNMRSTISAGAQEATDMMLGSLDARAAASGMSGGSRHGTATAQGMRDINQNMQDNLSQIGYDAYNKDYDRALQTGADADQLNQQIQLANQGTNLDAQLGNQGANLDRNKLLSDLINQQQGTSSDALGQSQNVQDYTSAELKSLMSGSAGIEFLQRMLGQPTTLSEQESNKSGYNSNVSFNLGR